MSGVPYKECEFLELDKWVVSNPTRAGQQYKALIHKHFHIYGGWKVPQTFNEYLKLTGQTTPSFRESLTWERIIKDLCRMNLGFVDPPNIDLTLATLGYSIHSVMSKEWVRQLNRIILD